MELRFVNREGDSLVFETADGQRLTATIDDAIRDALKTVSYTHLTLPTNGEV